MATSLVLQPGHGYILLNVAATGIVNTWAGVRVGMARKKYGVAYPQMYAEKDEKCFKEFNCIQRAHQNMIENLPVFFSLLFTSCIYRPVPAAIFGAIRIAGFIAYVQGYSTGDPSKRFRGGFGMIGLLGMLGLTIEASLKLIGIV